MEVETSSILEFKGEYSFLSNGYPSPVTYEGLTFSNSQAAFQAQKTLNLQVRKQFLNLDSQSAFELGRTIAIRPDWDKIKIDLMKEIITQKFIQNPDLKKRLLDTGNMVLIYGNYWNETFWGFDLQKKSGKNIVGRLLMEVRNELRRQASNTSRSERTDVVSENRQIIRHRQYTTREGRVYQLEPSLSHSLLETHVVEAGFHFLLRPPPLRNTQIEVTQESTIECIRRLVQEGFNTCALNFANGFHPGGGYLKGARAQEESCCRCSALFATLDQKKCRSGFYSLHENRYEATDTLIFSPDVPIFRDHSEELAPLITASFITSAAIDYRYFQGNGDEIMLSRIRKIIQLAAFKEQRALVLGAFGCGVFLNNPNEIAEDFRQVLFEEGYISFFDKIVFAIYCNHVTENYSIFASVFAP